jgi:hypothetical protein
MTAALGVAGASANAQNKELSDKSVALLMHYAWIMTPQKFTTPLGKVIEVDKTKQDKVVVPADVAREVIKVARLTAYAQLCDLPEEQTVNYQTFMRREEATGKWTDQQLLYINQLHLFTVMTMTGKIRVVQQEGDKQVIVQDGKAMKTETCTDTEKQKIQAQIMAYVNTAPPGFSAPATTGSTRADTVSTITKKK